MKSDVRYCKSGDGTRIAYSVCGDGRALVVPLFHPLSLESEMRLPQAHEFYDALAGSHSVIRYDMRGVGASERDVRDISFEAFVQDLEAIAAHLQLASFDIFAATICANTALVYAGRHPELVESLILWEPLGATSRESDHQTVDAVEQLIRSNWPLAVLTMANLVFPHGPLDLQRWATSAYRSAVAPEVAVQYWRMAGASFPSEYRGGLK